MPAEGDTEVLIEADDARIPPTRSNGRFYFLIKTTKWVQTGVKMGSNGEDPWSTDPNEMLRAKCALCSEKFAFPCPSLMQVLVNCPYCSKVSFMGAKMKKSEMLQLKVIGVIFILAGIAIMLAVPLGGRIAGDKNFNFIFGGSLFGAFIVFYLPRILIWRTKPVSETTTAAGDIPEEYQ